MSKNPAYRIAFKDISKHLRQNNLDVFDENGDIYTVLPYSMLTRETTILNKQLGIHKCNKYGERMKRHKKYLK